MNRKSNIISSGAFAKLQKKQLASLSVSPSVCDEITWLQLDRFSWNFIWRLLLKSVMEIQQVWLKLDKNIRCFTWRPKNVLCCWQHKCSSTIQKSILIIRPTRCTISQIYFHKALYMFRRDLLSIIRSLNTVYAIWMKSSRCVYILYNALLYISVNTTTSYWDYWYMFRL